MPRLSRVVLVLALLVTACELERRQPIGPENNVSQVLVVPDTITLDPLGAWTFGAYGRTATGDSVPVSVQWSASAGSITQNGSFTADSSDADVTVTATLSNSPIAGRATVRKRRVVQLLLQPAALNLTPGQTQQFTTRGVRNSGDTISVNATYSATGGTVTANGLYTAGSTPGPFLVIATRRALADTAVVTISNAPVASVTVSPSTKTLYVAGTAQLTATLRDAGGSILTGRAITWSSSAPSVASVSANGMVSAVAVGSATVTATSEGQSGTASITVAVVPVSSVDVTPSSASLRTGASMQLNAVAKDSAGNVLSGRVVTWSSNAPSVATVSADGTVSAVAAGSATITARSEGKSGTATVTVSPVPVATVTVAPASKSLSVGATTQLTATTTDSAGNVLTGRTVSWSSSAPAVATVSASGLVTAVAAGSTTITATSEGKSGTAAITVTAPPPPDSAQFRHVFIVTEENTNYANVIGSSSMPYLNSLAQQYGLATQYYANTHPSIGNYFMLSTGQIITNNDSYSTIVTADNIVRRLVAAGKTWKSYAENLPNACYLGGDTGGYARKHNIFALLSDVANDPSGQACNIVPFTQFANDLANGRLPDFSNIVPNLCNDAHDCSLSTADNWLRTNIDPLIKSSTFQQNGLLIIVFDEAGGDNTNGGGRIAWVAVSPKAKPGYQSTTLYQHQSTLRLILKGLGVTLYPGAAATAPDMAEFFNP